MTPLRVAILASGRGSNFIAIDNAIKEGKINAKIVVLISNNPKAKALESARQRGIETRLIPSKGMDRDVFDQQILDALKASDTQLIALAGFMRIVGRTLIKAYPNRIMNIHPALLPSFKGLHAQKQALDYGSKIAGCSVHFVDEGVDTGPIILQSAVDVLDDDTEDTLSERILKHEHRIYPQAVGLFAQGRLSVVRRRVIIKSQRD